jgi:hypothetical protein
MTPPALLQASAVGRPDAPVDAASGSDGFVVVDSSADRLLLLDRSLAFRRTLDGVVATPRAALPGVRPAVESVLVADGRKVVEIGLPTDSPLPVVETLRDRLAAQDVDGALALIDVSRRSLYRQIYERIAPELPAAAAAMSDPQVYELRDGYAVVIVKRTQQFQGQSVVNSYPIYLVRSGDGSWRILSY